MKIVHIVTSFGLRYGSDANLVNWLDWERRSGHEVVLLAGRSCAPAGVPPWLRVRVVDDLVREVRPGSDLRGLWSLRRVLREERPDMIHTHQAKAGILGRLAAAALPSRPSPVQLVHTVHMASFGQGFGRTSRAFELLERVCARWTDELVAVGEELRASYLAAHIGRPDRFRVIRSPARVEGFLSTREWPDSARAAVRAEWGLQARQRLVVTMGLLEPRKRQALVIRGLAPVLARGDAVLVVAGDGPLGSQLEAEARAAGVAGAVRLPGRVDRVEELLAIADVLVHASRVEGVPQAVLQALAAGVPVVATDAEGLREIPGAPITIVPADGEGLADQVQRILDDRGARAALPADALAPWTLPVVEQQIAALHATLAQRRSAVVATRGPLGRNAVRG